MRLRASGYSMYPYIYPTDICRFVPFQEPPTIGEVYLVASDTGILFSHRLHRIARDNKGTRYIFRGDGNRVFDPVVVPEQVIGVLVELKRKGTTLQEQRRVRQIWSSVSVRWPIFLLPFVWLGRWKKRFSRDSATEMRNAAWHLIYYRKDKSRR